jgi:hypothetical protein
MMAQIKEGKASSPRSTKRRFDPGALKAYGIGETLIQTTNMFGLIHQMRTRSSPRRRSTATGDRRHPVRKDDGRAGGRQADPQHLWSGAVPFLKVDKGLEEGGREFRMIQSQASMRCSRARFKGVFITKMRSVIDSPRRPASPRSSSNSSRPTRSRSMADHRTRSVDQSPDRAEAGRSPRRSVRASTLPADRQVMLKLTPR